MAKTRKEIIEISGQKESFFGKIVKMSVRELVKDTQQ
jgi:hypothetical protein